MDILEIADKRYQSQLDRNDWKSRAIDLAKLNIKPSTITNVIEREFKPTYSHKVLYYKIYRLCKKYGSKCEQTTFDTIDIQQPGRVKLVQNQEPEHVDADWNHSKIIKFGLIGDTQLGSKYTQLSYLHDFYDICQAEGIKDVYHTGDITEGLKMRPGHEYEVYTVAADEMLEDAINNYPQRDGITTHFITGNHDASLYKHIGYDIGRAIANARPDMKYLGRDCAVINLTPNCTMELRHPWDGSAYSLSYKIQKMIEAMECDTKPNILAVGHYHKAEYIFYRNIHAIQTGCFQGQTPFTRGKGISVHIGGWIVTLEVATDGTIKRIQPEFIPYYASIKDDYKKFRNIF